MNEDQKTVVDSVNKIMEEHGRQYDSYARLMLSLSTGLIGVLSAFRNFWIKEDDSFPSLAAITMLALIISFLSGMFVQHLIVLRGSQEVRAYLDEVNEKISNLSGKELYNRTPSTTQRVLFQVQYISFYVSIFFLSSYFLLNLKWS